MWRPEATSRRVAIAGPDARARVSGNKQQVLKLFAEQLVGVLQCAHSAVPGPARAEQVPGPGRTRGGTDLNYRASAKLPAAVRCRVLWFADDRKASKKAGS